MADPLPTGIDELDDALDGGVPPGSLVTLVAPPDTQSDLLLAAMSAANPTLFLSTVRPAPDDGPFFEGWHHRDVAADEDPGAIASLDDDPEPTETVSVQSSDLRANLDACLSGAPRGGLVIVDPATGLEAADRDSYRRFLNAFAASVSSVESAGVLHCVAGADPPARRSLTLSRADVVLRLLMDVRPEAVETYLAATKVRGGPAMTEPLDLALTDDVSVDTSRDIS